MKRLFDLDPTNNSREIFEYDEGEEKAYIHHISDAGPLLEQNKRAQTDDPNNGYTSKDRDLVHVAALPIGVIYLWLTKYGIDVFNKDHAPGVKRLLNDPDFRYLRVNHMIL